MVLDDSPYCIGGITLYFLPNDTVAIEHDGQTVKTYFPWTVQRDKQTVAWEILSMLEYVHGRSLSSFVAEWADFVGKDAANNIYRCAIKYKEQYEHLNVDPETIANSRRISAICMVEHKTPLDVAKEQLESARGYNTAPAKKLTSGVVYRSDGAWHS